jgi:peptidoglycan L-alanyl-D-glutamate endopeptidase CwlK
MKPIFVGASGLARLLVALVLMGAYSDPLNAQNARESSWPMHPIVAQLGISILLKAYPDELSASRDNELVWKDGTVTPYQSNSGAAPSFDVFLDHADLADQFSQAYPLEPWTPPPSVNSDPGRARCLAFFKKMYGGTQAEVERHLVSIRWMPGLGSQTVRVTTVNGIDRKLMAVQEELTRLPIEMQKRYLVPSAGAFNWRPIAGTDRLSMHSFGAAIDLNVDVSNYWKWTKPDSAERYPYHNNFPPEIVAIFERHGFIWGGKWYHYDTMHFEYRPELILAATTDGR